MQRYSTEIPVAKDLFDEIYARLLDQRHRLTNRLVMVLLVAQWISASIVGYFHGAAPLLVGLGGMFTVPAVVLALHRPERWTTRAVIALSQMGWSTMLIALADGNGDFALHAVASLTLLASYRDWTIVALALFASVIGGVTTGSGAWSQAGWLSLLALLLIAFALLGRKEVREAALREARLSRMKAIVERQVDERTVELQESIERFRSLVENSAVAPFELDRESLALLYIAPQASRFLECTQDEVEDPRFVSRSVHPDDRRRLRSTLREIARSRGPAPDPIDFRATTKTGRELHGRLFVSVGADRIHACCIDVTKQRQLEDELRQAQKLESIGRLAAGVAHEINTPLQFAGDSVAFSNEAVRDLLEVIQAHTAVVDAVLAEDPTSSTALAARAVVERVDFGYLREEIPAALTRAVEGVDRVAAIVKSMKQFVHPGGQFLASDLNHALQSTLVIARNEYRFVADVETELGDVPEVECRAGEINQVFLAILVNAAHAIAASFGTSALRGTISIRSYRDEDAVVFAIQDTGPGIPELVRDRIFDPFFTTKDVGKGTGQGLAIAKSIVERHGGTLTFETQLGRGTTFFVRLPIHQTPHAARAA